MIETRFLFFGSRTAELLRTARASRSRRKPWSLFLILLLHKAQEGDTVELVGLLFQAEFLFVKDTDESAGMMLKESAYIID